MQKIIVLLSALLMTVGSGAAVAQPPDAPRAPLGRIVDLWVTKTEQIIVPAADALPEHAYSFTPTAGEFAGVRSFAEQVKHLAAANYQLAGRVLREEPPAGTMNETAPASVETKAQIAETRSCLQLAVFFHV